MIFRHSLWQNLGQSKHPRYLDPAYFFNRLMNRQSLKIKPLFEIKELDFSNSTVSLASSFCEA